jgi:hypothetical protein
MPIIDAESRPEIARLSSQPVMKNVTKNQQEIISFYLELIGRLL